MNIIINGHARIMGRTTSVLRGTPAYTSPTISTASAIE